MKNNILRIVKMTALYSFRGILLQTLLVGFLFASSPAEGQNLKDVKVTVKAVNVTFQEALVILEQKTDFKFNFIREEIPLKENVTLSVTDESLYNILEVFANDYGLIFNRINNQITIKKATGGETEKVTTIAEIGSIKGRITDDKTKEPLIGANITIKGTTIGTTTNKNGEYRIDNLKPGEYTVVFKYIGYAAISEVVRVESGKTTEVNIALGQSTVNLDEVTVTGSLAERSFRESSNAINVLTPRDFQNRNLTDLSTAFIQIPSMSQGSLSYGGPMGDSRAGSGGLSYLNMRGYSHNSSDMFGNGTKFIIDGVEQNGPAVVRSLDPDQIEKIEIAVGPMATTLYGSGSLNGAIQIFTKKGLGQLSGYFKTMFISKDEKFQLASPIIQNYSVGLSGSEGAVGFTLAANYYHSPSSRWQPENINENNWNFSAGLYGKFSDIEIGLNAQLSSDKFGTLQNPMLTYLVAQERGLNNYANYYKSKLTGVQSIMQNEDKVVNLSVNIKQRLSDKLFHRLTAGFSTYDRLVDETQSSYSYYYKNVRTYNTQALKYFANYKDSFWDDFTFEFTGGAEYTKHSYPFLILWMNAPFEIYKTQSLYTSSPGPGTASYITMSTTGLFGETVIGYNKNLYLTLGYRTESNNSYGSSVGWYSLPRAGLTYVMEFGDYTIKPRISVGSSTQPLNPTFALYDKTVSTYYTIIQLANPDLKPQQQAGYEFGVDFFYSDFLSFSATYFNQTLKNLVESVSYPPVGTTYTSQFVNRARVDKDGIELKLTSIMEPFRFLCSMTALTSRYGEGTPESPSSSSPYYYKGGFTQDTPPNSYYASLSYIIPPFLCDKGGEITLEYRYTAGSIRMDTGRLYEDIYSGRTYKYYYETDSPISSVNLRFNYSITNNLLVFTDIQNLLNRQELIKFSYPQAGRNISFGFNWKY